MIRIGTLTSKHMCMIPQTVKHVHDPSNVRMVPHDPANMRMIPHKCAWSHTHAHGPANMCKVPHTCAWSRMIPQTCA